MKNLCVFCGSSKGSSLRFIEQTQKLGDILVDNGINLVYGGGSIGLMGILADRIIESGGLVTGVIPHFLVEKEVDHKGISKMIIVDSMHERKQTMAELSDGFIALPGGFGTLEELAEILTWSQLGLIQKPIGVLNLNGFYDSLIELLNTMENFMFLKKQNKQLLIVDEDPSKLLQKLKDFRPRQVEKWLRNEQT